MGTAREETAKRLRLAEEEAENYPGALGVILAGSVAYSPNLNVTEKSDLDIVVVYDNLRGALPLLVEDPNETGGLAHRFFDGYSVKGEREGVPVSVHALSADAFDIVSKCFVADIRLYRPDPKPGTYVLRGFEGNEYEFRIKNMELDGLAGVRTVVPVSFINRDRYFLGIHRDKLLSTPRILAEQGSYVTDRIERLWLVVVQNLMDEAHRLYGGLDLARMNVLNALAKKGKMSPDSVEKIEDRTRFYISRVR